MGEGRVGWWEGWTKWRGRGMVVAMRRLPDSVVVWCGRRSEGAGVLCGGVCEVEVQREWGRLL